MLRVQTPPLPVETREQRMILNARELIEASDEMLVSASSMAEVSRLMNDDSKLVITLLWINAGISVSILLTSLYVVMH